MLTSELYGSLEAVSHPGNYIFKAEIIEAYTKLSKIKRPTLKDVIKVDIAGIIKRHTNLNIAALILENEMNACVFPPSIDHNHTLLNVRHGFDFNNADAVIETAHKGTFLSGSVDLEKGRVSGIFSEFKTILGIGDKFIGSRSIFTPGEAAAVTMHEIGHVFTYYEMLGLRARTNIVMHAATQSIVNTTDRIVRVKILADIEGLSGKKFTDKDKLVESNNAEGYRAVIFTNMREGDLSESGVDFYDNTAFEAMSDQYSSRMGLSRDLVTAMTKLHNNAGLFGLATMQARSRWSQYAMNLLKVTFWLTGVVGSIMSANVFNLVMNLMILLDTSRPQDFGYDVLADRMKRVENDLVSLLANKKLPKELKQATIADLEAIRLATKDLIVIRGIYESLLDITFSKRRIARSSFLTQQRLEELQANKLYESAAKLTTI